MSVIKDVLEILEKEFKSQPMPMALHEPLFQGREWEYVKDCLDSGWVSSVGQYVDRFEKQLSEVTGSPFAICVANGTVALHLGLILAGVKPGDEVLVPAMTFVATANAVAYCGAIPHFCDSSSLTLGLDPRKLEKYLDEISEVRGGVCFNRSTGRALRAMVPMHTFGHAVELAELVAVAKRFSIPLIEDAAESLGTYYKGRHTGTFGVLGTLSFNGNKIITCGGGGAILTADKDLAVRAKHLSTTAKLAHPFKYEHDEVGYNYRLPNLNAALGCAQLEQLPLFVDAQRSLAARYEEIFALCAGVKVFKAPSFSKSNYWLNALILQPEHRGLRDQLLMELNEKGFKVRPAWALLHGLPMYQKSPKMDLSVCEDLEKRIINIPSSAKLGRQ